MSERPGSPESTLPRTMRAMRIHRLGPVDGKSPPLEADRIERPDPGTGELLVRVRACGVCHT
ncbi:MAG: hypothetical protein HKP03_10770, partial [Xanthomonadales bacterium]|nr:hypothetical protein [Xanthomonadales bacterium]